jgi:CheY-like chemotaxis protein/Tfp pilus assembly protein PilZ
MIDLNGKKILVVDDEPLLRELIREELESLGANALEAEGGNSALALAQRNPLDLVISDIKMPNGDGITLLKNLSQLAVRKPVVLLMTGFADVTPAEVYDLGAVGILSKPFDLMELAMTVRKILTPRAELWTKNDEIPKSSVRTLSLLPSDSNVSLRQPFPKLGQGGLFLPLSKDFPKEGEVIRFQAQVEDFGDTLEGYAVVRWIRHQKNETGISGIGVEFITLQSGALDHVMEYLARVKPRAFIPLE